MKKKLRYDNRLATEFDIDDPELPETIKKNKVAIFGAVVRGGSDCLEALGLSQFFDLTPEHIAQLDLKVAELA